MRGTMLWFNETKDAGFIEAEDGVRIHVVGTAFADGVRPQGRCAGVPVLFEVTLSGDELHAVDVRIEPEVAQRRARRRGGSFR